MFIGIIKNITGFIDDLNLTKKDVAGIIVVGLLVCAGLSANHYKSKANRLQVSLDLVNSEGRIEKYEYKIAESIKKNAELQKTIDSKNAELLDLYGELKDVRKMTITRTEIMEGLGEINNTEDACNAIARAGYRICIP